MVVYFGFVVNKVAMGKFFLREIQLELFIPQKPHAYLSVSRA